MKKRAVSLLLAISMMIGLLSLGFAAGSQFADDDGSGTWAWAGTYIYDCYERNIINGYEDGTYLPDKTLTRAEAAKIIAIAMDLDIETEAVSSFQDVADDNWAVPYIEACAEASIISGYEDGTFLPSKSVSRAEMAKMIAVALGIGTDGKDDLISSFADVSADHWALMYIEACVDAGILNGMTETTFEPGSSVTRAQAAKIISCALAYVEGGGSVSHSADTEQEDETDADSVSEASMLTVDGTTYYIGQTLDDLLESAGNAEETLSSTYGFTWYVFGTSTYKNFFAAGVYNGKVAALSASGLGFEYQGMTAGDEKTGYETDSSLRITVATDKNDSYAVHAVLIMDSSMSLSDTSSEALAGESKMIFHLTNAFRVLHGKRAFTWSAAAAAAAQLHSQDMADQGYFDHYSLDGTSPWERMSAQGIRYSSAAENIYSGTAIGFSAYSGWVNSSGHRSNMLGSYTYLGVGAGCSGSAFCFTQDFYS